MGLLVSMDDCGAQVQIGNNTWKLISAMFHSQCSRCKSVKINMPYREMSKTQVAMLGLTLKAPIAQTYSCQVNSQNPCGACPNCIDRIVAMNNLLKKV